MHILSTYQKYNGDLIYFCCCANFNPVLLPHMLIASQSFTNFSDSRSRSYISFIDKILTTQHAACDQYSHIRDSLFPFFLYQLKNNR